MGARDSLPGTQFGFPAVRVGAARTLMRSCARPGPWPRQSSAPSERKAFRFRTFFTLAALLFLSKPGHSAAPISRAGQAFLEDLEHRAFLYFWEQANPETGLVHDRARADGGVETKGDRNIASSAATGFGLSGLCIAAERGWIPREQAHQRALITLRYYAQRAEHNHGWFYHFVDATSGERRWKSEISSIDTSLLLGGVLTARQCFHQDAELIKLATQIYERVDFQWMLNGDPSLLSHGFHPETGFIKNRWDSYCEHMILYVLAIGSPTHPIPPESWYAWQRPQIQYAGFTFVGGPPPLFVHQYSHAWVDFRARREDRGSKIDYWANSVTATRAHREFCLRLAQKFPGYSANVWGITASDSAKGYVAWGGPPEDPSIDGTVVPCAAAGSLMFTPDIALPALREMRQRFGDRVYKHYGFVDAFHPINGWTNPDVIGIDQGITLLSAENLRTGNVWKWFMANREISAAMDGVGLQRHAGSAGASKDARGLSATSYVRYAAR